MIRVKRLDGSIVIRIHHKVKPVIGILRGVNTLEGRGE